MTRKRLDTSERDRLLDAAIEAGKFSERRRGFYAALYDKNPTSTTALIGMMAGIGPAATAPVATAAVPDDAYEESALTPAERERARQARSVPGRTAKGAPIGEVGGMAAAGPYVDPDGMTPHPPTRSDDNGGYNESFLSPAERKRAADIKAGTFEHPVIEVARDEG